MAGWYDFIPGVGAAVEAAKGNYGTAFADLSLPGSGYVIDKYTGAIGEQKQGLSDASQQSAALANRLYGESMQGLDRAQAQFAPARAAALYGYGDPSAMTGGPAMYPAAPPRPR